MGFIHFPSQLTEEEHTLKNKYAKLKRKRKQLKPQPSKEQEQKEQANQILANIVANKRKAQEGIAKPDAKELAKKLLKSGAIKAIRPEPQEKTVFKRSKQAERRRTMIGTEMGYQPFAEPSGKGSDASSSGKLGALDQDDPKLLAEKEFHGESSAGSSPQTPSRKGNTIYLNAQGVTEPIARKACSAYGNIAHISVEENKNCAFVTFETTEAAEKAITTLDGSFVAGLTFKATLARRQPPLPASSTPPAQPSAPSESRVQVVYDDFF